MECSDWIEVTNRTRQKLDELAVQFLLDRCHFDQDDMLFFGGKTFLQNYLASPE